MAQNILQFLNPWTNQNSVLDNVKEFTRTLGWYPNEAIIEKDRSTFVEGHVFVEHGLDNTAVISFLNKDKLLIDLKGFEIRKILSISYNNLTDIHYIIDRDQLNCINNLDRNEKIIYSKSINDINLQTIISEELIKAHKSDKVHKALDEAFINTIRYWQDRVYQESNGTLNNISISNLFNILIFLRAVEDHKKVITAKENLLSFIDNQNIENLAGLVKFSLDFYKIERYSPYINYLEIDEIDKALSLWFIKKIIAQFYESDYAPYPYDFAVMSKHSLSRIYEEFVKIFTTEYSPQMTLFGPQTTTKLVSPQKSGIVYTPEFIARFFARYSKELIDVDPNYGISMLEPAVGSGIFVRTFLEYQLAGETRVDVIDNKFKQIDAFDINATACKAANLSLALLYLSLTGNLPSFKFNIKEVDNLDWFLLNNTRSKYNLVISNPPFISYHDLPYEIRSKVKGVLNDTAVGFPDLYFAFIKIAIESLQKDGIGMFVVPHTFMVSKSAGKLRSYLGKNATILAIVDLTGSMPFESADVYPILLIFQKTRLSEKALIQNVSIVKADKNIGEALSKFLKNEEEVSATFSFYKLGLPLNDSPWYLHTPAHRLLLETLKEHKPLSEYFEVRTGMTAGNKDIFIQNTNAMIEKDKAIWAPFAADKDLKAYDLLSARQAKQFFFYPYKDDTLLTEDELKEDYPTTYKFLLKQKEELQARAEFVKQNKTWFSPNRPRKPSFMMVPKLLTPHLCITPKFAYDFGGKFAIARSPFICLKQEVNDTELSDHDLFYYLLGILHSRLAFWYMSQHSSSYSQGYLMLEKASLENLPIPAPNQILNENLIRFIELVKMRVAVTHFDFHSKMDESINEEVFKFYGLTTKEKEIFSHNL